MKPLSSVDMCTEATRLEHEACDVDRHDGEGEVLVCAGGQGVQAASIGGGVLVEARELCTRVCVCLRKYLCERLCLVCVRVRESVHHCVYMCACKVP